VLPDLASYGKIVGGGGPLGCVAGKSTLIDATNPKRKGRSDYAYINGTLHGNPIASVAGVATIRELRSADFYTKFHQKANSFRTLFQQVLNQNGIPAIVAGQASFWQLLFSNNEPSNQMDVLRSDMTRSEQLDLELLRNGVFVLPNVRRFFSAVHDDQDLHTTIEALDASCKKFLSTA
jgi:glutamate-1-semialdehyde 2,1-aminomutase